MIKPWPKGLLAKAYKEIAHEGWDKIEAAAVRATRRRPTTDDSGLVGY